MRDNKFVYFFNIDDTHFVKVGISKRDPLHVRSSQQSLLPGKLSILQSISTKHPEKWKEYISLEWKEFRSNGLWFKLDNLFIVVGEVGRLIKKEEPECAVYRYCSDDRTPYNPMEVEDIE